MSKPGVVSPKEVEELDRFYRVSTEEVRRWQERFTPDMQKAMRRLTEAMVRNPAAAKKMDKIKWR